MAEIWNLSTLCRCCHKDGQFTNLTTLIEESDTRNYTTLLQETFNVSVDVHLYDASNAICDSCIKYLIRAHNFKVQLVGCEQKYHEYIQNELATQCELKEEVESLPENVSDDKDHCGFDDSETEEHTDDPVEPKLDDEKPEQNLTPDVPYISPQTLHPEVPECVKDEGDKRIVTLKGIDEEICNKPKIKNNKFAAKKREIQKVQKETFSCKKCKYKTICYDYLVWHDISQHRTDKKHYCGLCDNAYLHRKNLRKHLHAKHYNINVKHVLCELCGKRFDHGEAYYQHRRSVHGNARFTCDLCSATFKVKISLKTHILKHSGVHSYKCDECEKAYFTMYSLKAHKQTHLRNKEVGNLCSICKESFPRIGDLRKHYKTGHQSDLPYKCEHCPKRFSNKHYKKLHVDIHHLGIRFTCPICKAIYKDKSVLRYHIKSKHEQVTQKVKLRKCLECNRNYGDYEKHKRFHENSLVRCEVCKKPYSTQFSLKRHMATAHGPKKLFECEQCQKKLIGIGGYQKHLKRHAQGYFFKNGIKKKKDIEIDEFKSDTVGATKQKKQLEVRSTRSRRSNIERQ